MKKSQDSWNKIGETFWWEKRRQMEAAKKIFYIGFALFKAILRQVNEWRSLSTQLISKFGENNPGFVKQVDQKKEKTRQMEAEKKNLLLWICIIQGHRQVNE